jgi:type III restriction enzyme
MSSVEATYRYIVATPGVRGGNPRIQGTRIGVHDVVSLLQNGETVDSMPRCFPGISRAQVYECLAYYEDHQTEIDLLVARQLLEEEA